MSIGHIPDEVDFAVQAVFKLKPNAVFSVNSTYESLNWRDDTQTKPTKKEFEDCLASIKLEYENNDYARKRELEYPSLQELVVALYDEDDKTEIENKRAAIKAKYPKP